MSRWIDSNLADRLYMVQKRINFPVPMIHVPLNIEKKPNC